MVAYASFQIEDILFSILSRLPVKSLCSFLCVSKFWNSTISNRHFINPYGNYSLTRPEGAAIAIALPERFFRDGTLINPEHCEHDDLVVVHSAEISLSVHGLVLVNKSFSRCRILNPSTRQITTLPVIESETIPNLCPVSWSKRLGYDPINNQHKVLANVLMYSQDKRTILTREIYVFVIGGVSWRKLSKDIVSQRGFGDGVCINGILYIMSSREELVVAFDVRLETFRSIPMFTRSFAHDGLLVPFEFDGHLAIVYFDPLHIEKNMDIWILKDSLEPNWIHKHLVFPFEWSNVTRECLAFYIVGVLPKGGFLVASRDPNKHFLFTFNLEIANVREVDYNSLKYTKCCSWII